MTGIALGYLQNVSYSISQAISIYNLKEVATANRLVGLLQNKEIVPWARTTKQGQIIENIAFAVPMELMATWSNRSYKGLPWPLARRNPREAADTARILQKAILVTGLTDSNNDSVNFYLVPNDNPSIFSDNQNSTESLVVRALESIADSLEKITKGLKVSNTGTAKSD